MPLVTFIIPVRHQDNARDWQALKSNLVQTVASISNQTNGDWRGIIVANEGADIPPLPEKFSVERVTFPPNDLYELGKASREEFYDAFRADKGRRVLAGMLRARGSDFFMIVDDDDLVSARIVQFVSEHRAENGWTIDKGFIWDSGGRLLFRYNEFNRLCGTSLIVRSGLYGLPEQFDQASPDWIKDMLGSHVRIADILSERGTPLHSLPFRGAVYRVAHGGSHSQAPSLLAQHFFNRDILRHPRWLFNNLRRLRVVDDTARREFFGKRPAPGRALPATSAAAAAAPSAASPVPDRSVPARSPLSAAATPGELAVTVVFSSYNGAGRLRRTLDSLVRQTLPADQWELIAVDNNSSDDTFDLLESYRGRLPITTLRHPVPGKSGALNAALERARGDLVVFTDDDIEADPGWLAALAACADALPGYGIFGGRIVPDWERDPVDAPFLKWIPMGSTFAIVDESESGPCDPTKVWGPNTAIRRSLLGPETRYREDIGPAPGGFFAMGEDSEIVLRLARRGVGTYRCAEAVIRHFVPAASMNERWVQQRAERLGYGMPAVFPDEVPDGPRLRGVPLKTWLESFAWLLRAAILYPLPSNRLRFWAIWKTYYLRGYIAGLRRYAVR